nr:hypothetical protein [Tanacetum cinerariifolium]
MTLIFAETHNMIAYLTKFDAIEGFNQIINFLNGSSIKYDLTVNPNIYVSCIKQFWNSVVVKKVNDVTRLQAIVDKKKVMIMKVSIRDALCLDDSEGVECLPNEELFIELARIGYEKPSTKLTFYKAFFSSQWKFLIHTILQCMSAKRTSWNEFSSSMASAVICLSSSRKFNFSKYIFDSLVRNVDSPTKFYMYPCFLQLMIRKQVGDADEVPVEDVNAASVATEGDVSAANDEVLATVDEPSIPFPTPPTPPPQPFQDIPFTSQAQPTPPQSPQVQPQSPQQQPQPSQDAGISMDLIQNLMDTCTNLSRRVKQLELDKIAQALEITKLKQRVKKLEKRNKLKVLKFRRLKRVGSAQRIDTSDDTVMDDDVAVEKSGDVEDNADIQGRITESQAQIYQIDLEHANKVLSIQDEEESETAKLQEVVDVVTTAKIITEVVTAASITITAAVGNKMHKAFPLPGVCTAMMKKLPVKERWQLH